MTTALWIAVTLVVYLAAWALHARTGLALLNPALVSIATVIALLVVTRTPYAAGEGDVEGATSGMAMGAVGALTALLAPPLLTLVLRALGRA